MGKPKFDGVIEAVHYKPEGHVDWIRAYLRRGPTFTDRKMLDRSDIIDNLKSGKRYFAGSRIPLMASTFKTGKQLRLVQKNNREFLVIGDFEVEKDCLEDVPII